MLIKDGSVPAASSTDPAFRRYPLLVKLFHPETFQGSTRRSSYFEGVYFKVVIPEAGQVWAFIPGMSGPVAHEPDGHAFIQVFSGHSGHASYESFPMSDFSYSCKELDIAIAGNSFSMSGIELQVPGEHGVSASLQFGEMVKWPWSWRAPGIIGWYSYIPFMQCNHGLVSMHHSVRGWIEAGGARVSFDNAQGYIEKDWGSSFPETWIWLQCNSFEQPGISIMFSLAKVPWLGHYFPGFLCCVLYEGAFHYFTTWSGARILLAEISGNRLDLVIEDRRFRLVLKAFNQGGARLVAPVFNKGMSGHVNESLRSLVEFELYRKTGSKYERCANGRGKYVGLEIAGDVSVLGVSVKE